MANRFLKKLKGASQTAAMADMAMLLLIFFLVTTTSEIPDEPIELPRAETEGTQPNSFYISIAISGRMYWSNEVVDMAGLQNKLAANRHDNDKNVVIYADKDLNYSQVIPVLDMLKEYEFLKVIYQSEPREGDGT